MITSLEALADNPALTMTGPFYTQAYIDHFTKRARENTKAYAESLTIKERDYQTVDDYTDARFNEARTRQQLRSFAPHYYVQFRNNSIPDLSIKLRINLDHDAASDRTNYQYLHHTYGIDDGTLDVQVWNVDSWFSYTLRTRQSGTTVSTDRHTKRGTALPILDAAALLGGVRTSELPDALDALATRFDYT